MCVCGFVLFIEFKFDFCTLDYPKVRRVMVWLKLIKKTKCYSQLLAVRVLVTRLIALVICCDVLSNLELRTF